MAIKIFIDQGHNPPGYPNAGAEANGLYEGDINYQVGIYLNNLLNNDSRFDSRVSRLFSATEKCNKMQCKSVTPFRG